MLSITDNNFRPKNLDMWILTSHISFFDRLLTCRISHYH